jgi:hypothetical protein
MPDSPNLYIDYGKTNVAGQNCSDIGTGLGVLADNSDGCVAAARAFPAWATSEALITVHAAHKDNIKDHGTYLVGTGNDIQASVGIISSADNTSAKDAAGISIPEEA